MDLHTIRALAAEWRRLREAATEEPWAVGCTDSGEEDSARVYASQRPVADCNRRTTTEEDEHNAVFIVHAANTPVADVLDQLVAEVERLRRFEPRPCPDDVPCPTADNLE